MNDQQQHLPGKSAPKIELLPPSISVRVGNRRLTMSWRPRKQIPYLLNGLLRRSWRAMFGSSLRMSATAIAICAAWNVPAMAAAPDVNTLPTGGTVTYGNATFTQNGNTLNINQTTGQAIANFTTFSIGSNAVVNVNQPSAAAAFLARVTGSDPSLIYGLLKSNGTVALINQNGILVGPTGVVDVARFIASTLRISDSDFLAGRLNFSNGALAGNVENQGAIRTASGGSVYLIGANVSNSGVITSANGEILLAAGQTVQLVDTGTPGVTVNITGTTGKVTNLGAITAEAGRIGVAAGLISNSGNINASSVVSDGGRIFLRASQNLTTTASSRITADGASKGGSVVLYSDKVAYLDGDISATGAAGKGGFVETSGKQSLDVVRLPAVGSGGEWYIDPYNLEVVADTANNITPGGGNPNVITSDSSSSFISASTINGLLDSSTSVTLVTGSGGSANGGNITVSADITKSAGTQAVLTLNADNNIVINANITSTSDKLGLNLNTNVNGATMGVHGAQVNGATIGLNGGTLNVSEGAGGNGNGNLSINNGGLLDLTSTLTDNGYPVGGAVNTGNLTINAGGAVLATFGANVVVNGALLNNGTLNLQNSHLTTNSLNNSASLTLGNVSGSLGAVVNTGTLSLASMFAGVSATSVDNAGTLTLSNGSTLNAGAVTNRGTATLNASTLNASTITNTHTGTMNFVDSSASVTDKITNAGVFSLSNGTINAVNGFVNQLTGTLNLATQGSFNQGALSNLGTLNIDGANIKFENGMTNAGMMNVSGSVIANGTMSNAATGSMNFGTVDHSAALSGSGTWENYGTLNVNGDTSFGNGLTNAGTMNVNASVIANGMMTNAATGSMNLGTAGNSTVLSGSGMWNNYGAISVAGAGNTVSIGNLQNNLGGTVQVTGSGTQLNVDQFSNAGTFTLGSGSSSSGSSFSNTGNTTLNGSGMSYGSFLNDVGGNLSGTGSITTGTLVNNGTLAPGGDGTIGTLAILGNYEQQSEGKLLIDISSTGNDVLDLAGMGTLVLDGTLQTKLLNGYAPTIGTAPVAIITGTTQNDETGVFRHVVGDVLTGGTLRMFKPTYGKSIQNLSVSMRGSEDITYNDGGWGSAGSWSTYYFPTAIDNIIVPESISLSHYFSDGIDIVNSITLNNNSQLDVAGGTVRVGNINSTGTTGIAVSGEGGSNSGVLNVSGAVTTSNLSVMGTGTLNGDANSTINVTDSFTQSGTGLISTQGDIGITQVTGDIVLGNISARNMVLESKDGAIYQGAGQVQQDGPGPQQVATALHISRQLITSSTAGTTLNSSGNQIAAFAGNNNGTGDITVTNTLNTSYASAVTYNGITNNGGSITVDNTGAAQTAAIGANANFLSNVSSKTLASLGIASNGTVSATGNGSNINLSTHSPLTIGSGGVTSSGGIILSAGAPDNLVINGAITSTGSGTISLAAGGSIYVNANIFTQGLYNTAPASPFYAAGVSVTDSSGTSIPVAQIIQQIISPVIAQSIAPAANNVVTSIVATQGVNNTIVPPTLPASNPNPVTSSSTMTTGGEPGTFGGSDTPEKNTSSQKSGASSGAKPAAKMYCN